MKRVHVGEGAWIGSAAIVMADVGAHTVVAAGSLVHEPIPPAVVVGGVPVRILKRRGPSGRPVLGDPSEANTESNNVNQWGSKMTPESIERSVAQAVARLARIPEAEVDLSRSAVDNGIDSLGLLVLRESLERRLHVHITDDAWTGFDSLRDVVAYVGASSEVSAFSWADPSPARAHDVQFRPAPYLTDTGLFHDAVEIGMPITGLNNLAESPLLKYLGHLRWSHLSAVCGVPSRDVTDTDGHRLYPTFFYIDLQFPEHRHMASYGENDRLKVVSTLERFGASMLDGVIYLLPGDWPDGGPLRFDGLATAVAAGVPAARMSNIFVKQFGGAEWLKKSRPANSGFDRIREVAVAPDSYRAVKEAERNGCFECAPDGFVRMTPGSVSLDYDLVADRDLNGAGLVYFANYPLFLDICERRALKGCRFGLSDELLDRRSLVRRRSAYLNNASSRDTLSVEVEAWLENPAILGHPAPEAAPVRLFINHRMRRCSDGRLMMVSTAEKVLSGYCLEDLPFFKDLLAEYRDTSDQLVVGCTH
ncbi:MAG: hypothetical protein HYS05_18050 [Acidobacteria bacterium]|nr:hypothetical protein [Acidobacteriota bacterium]